MMILLVLLLLPAQETMMYETYDKGKTGQMAVVAEAESLGHRVTYTWEDRVLEVIFDTVDMSTVYARKTVGGKVELLAERKDRFEVLFKGSKYSHRYAHDEPIYDRHAIEYTLRGFAYTADFKKTIRFHVPEFTIVNADITVVDQGVIDTQTMGGIECWKVKLAVKVLLFGWSSYFWIEKTYPHRFTKFEDEKGEHMIRLIEYQQGTE
jgi:hypothetical protein